MKAKKIIASILMIASLVSVSVFPAYAVTDYQSQSNFWQWIADGAGGIPQKVLGYISGDAVCPDSEDGKHHASSAVLDKGAGHFACTCAYCGETYTATKTDLSNAYTDAVNDMQFKRIDNEGGLYWQTTVADFYSANAIGFCGSYRAVPYQDTHVTVRDGGDKVYCSSFGGGKITGSADFQSGFAAPITGVYTVSVPLHVMLSCYKESGDHVTAEKSCDIFTTSVNAGGQINVSGVFVSITSVVSCEAVYELPVFRIITPSLPTETEDTYAPSSRPVSITGDYSVVGDNNEVFVHNEEIFSEDNSTFYNPVTGDTTNVENWTYDYSTRTYNFTDGEDNESSLTYGDDNIVINDGGNTFNLYYGNVTENSGSGSGDNGSGSSSGSGIFGKIGDLLGTLVGGILDLAEAFFSKILDHLTSLAEMIGDKLSAIVEMILGWFDEVPRLFTGFLGFLNAIFPFIPVEVMMLLEFGIAAVVFIAIIKALRR